MDTIIILLAKYLFLVVILIALIWAYIIYKKKRKDLIKILNTAILSLPLAYIIAKILSHFIQDPRPFVVEHTQPLIAHAADNGFPSDHTLLTMTIAAIVFTFNKKLGIILTILSLIVGIARVMARVHHPLDILGSIVISIVSVYLVTIFLKKYPKFPK